jgi:hypothetical protein
MSLTIILFAIALVLGISTLHVWAFLRKPRPRRGAYLIVLVPLFIGTLFIPIDDGGGHLQTIHLWAPYYFLAVPEFYRTDSRDLEIDCAVIGLPLVQHLTCVLLASLAVHKRQEATQALSLNGR